jgi:sec-independent protein translocase protein TatB
VLGINGSEFIVLLAVAAVVLGPERLPRYTQQLTQLIRELRKMAASAQDKVREELGPEFDEVDWRALDPRQYDPRRIVREALTDVVDVNDPLGMGNDPLGIGRDPLGLKDVSPGGPSANGRPPAWPADQPAGRSANQEVEEPAFDPDAT